jgi:hypothetical protein
MSVAAAAPAAIAPAVNAVVLTVGPSQAGKSTFVSMVMDPSYGEPPAVGDGSVEVESQ